MTPGLDESRQLPAVGKVWASSLPRSSCLAPDAEGDVLGLPPKGQRCAAAVTVQTGGTVAGVRGRRGVSVYPRVGGATTVLGGPKPRTPV